MATTCLRIRLVDAAFAVLLALSVCTYVEGQAATTTTTTTVTPLSVPPSLNWYGNDGSWSAIALRVGQPEQWVDVMVSTVSSETWVVASGGCGVGDRTCYLARGGTLDPTISTTWEDQGFFELGVDSRLGGAAYAQYGLDNLTFGGTGVRIPSAIIGAFNGTGPISGTSYLLGSFGLGVVPGAFSNTSPLSALSALVEDVGAVPSHSWAYTAGARYQEKGVLASLTLGGFDANRFYPHEVTFNLDPAKQLSTFIDSISMSSSDASSDWSTPVELLTASDRVSAIIDSSTPYLWLPQAVCERFARNLGLTYDTSLNLYTFDANNTRHDTLSASSLSFIFTLSDFSSSPATVEISLPYAAFDLQLTFPAIPFTNFGDANATKYYFPLRQATNEGQYTIGRAFLQEAYVITDYERNTFSVYQAAHPTDSVGNTSIVSIMPPADSTFSGNPVSSASRPAAGAIAGIAIGAVLLIATSTLLIFYLCRRKRHVKEIDLDSEKPLPLQAPQKAFQPRLDDPNQTPPAVIHEASGSSSYPTEVGADASHECYELPASFGPAELDCESSTESLAGSTEHGEDFASLSSYELARRKLERQQAAAAFALSSPREAYPVEKSDLDVSQVAHYRPPDSPRIILDGTPVSPIVHVNPNNSNAHTNGSLAMISPVSSGFTSASISPTTPPPTYHRFALAPNDVVYAGPRPGNVQLPPVGSRGLRDGWTGANLATEAGGTHSSLGSQVTDHGSGDFYGTRGANSVSPTTPGFRTNSNTHPGSSIYNDGTEGTATESRTRYREQHATPGRNMSILDPFGSNRRLDGEDLVHVPQLAETRFSWED